MKKLLVIATAAGVLLAGSAFAQTNQPSGQMPSDKGSNIEQKNVQSSSGASAGTATTGTGMKKEMKKEEMKAGSGANQTGTSAQDATKEGSR